MLGRVGFGLVFAIAGFAAAAMASYFLMDALSSNVHDRSVEAAMTSAFVFGPIGGFSGFIAGWIFGGRRLLTPAEDVGIGCRDPLPPPSKVNRT